MRRGREGGLKRIFSYWILVPLAVLLGLAPLGSEPHLVEKLRMLTAGTLTRPIDIFDLFFHATPIGLLAFRVALDVRARRR